MVPATSACAAHHAYIASAELQSPRHHTDKIDTHGIDLCLRACSMTRSDRPLSRVSSRADVAAGEASSGVTIV
jgi:hypothetical protein